MKEQGFCYKLADFSVKARKVLQELQTQSEFHDVSLGCSDSEGKMLKAHMAILSSFSSVLNNMFKQVVGDRERNNVALYLSGISHQDLSSILDFIYQGEVAIMKEQMESFLSTAQELEVFGLTGDIPKDDTIIPIPSNSLPKAKDFEAKFDSILKDRDSGVSEEESTEDENYSNFSSKLSVADDLQFVMNDFKMEEVEANKDETGLETVNYDTEPQESPEKRKSHYGKCKLCGKQGRRD